MVKEDQIRLNNRRKLLFTALMDMAMRNRETYWREDIERIRNAKPEPGKNRKEERENKRDHKKNHAKRVADFIKSQEAFNKKVYQYIDLAGKEGEIISAQRYDSLVAILGGITERIFDTKNPVELMAVIDMYHAGAFEEALKILREEREKNRAVETPVENPSLELKDNPPLKSV